MVSQQRGGGAGLYWPGLGDKHRLCYRAASPPPRASGALLDTMTLSYPHGALSSIIIRPHHITHLSLSPSLSCPMYVMAMLMVFYLQSYTFCMFVLRKMAFMHFVFL